MHPRHLLAPLAAVAVLAGCSSDPGPSLDQQQQTWEKEVSASACGSIEQLSPGWLETQWAVGAMAEGAGSPEDLRIVMNGSDRVRPYNCDDQVFQRYYEEQLVRKFPDSPKGQVGETTKPAP